jgi:aspartate-semialdehyde dehydrogenase
MEDGPKSALGCTGSELSRFKMAQGIIANPNCSTIQMVVVLKPIRAAKDKRVVVTTFQSVSGTGKSNG